MGRIHVIHPHEQCFSLLQQRANQEVDAAQFLIELLELGPAAASTVQQRHDREQPSELLTHQLFKTHNRKDLRDLACALGAFVGVIAEVVPRLQRYHVAQPSDRALMLCRIIKEQARIMAEAIPMLEHAEQHEAVQDGIFELHCLANEAETIIGHALATLYEQATDIPTMVTALRWGELYRLLEEATGRAEDIADILEAIILKQT